MDRISSNIFTNDRNIEFNEIATDSIQVCDGCKSEYDPIQSPSEIKESGVYMCNDCWDAE